MRRIVLAVATGLACMGLCSCTTTESVNATGEGRILVAVTTGEAPSEGKALLFLDGKHVGESPIGKTTTAIFYCTPGNRELVLKAPGFSAYRDMVRVVPNDTVWVEVELQPLPAEKPPVDRPEEEHERRAGEVAREEEPAEVQPEETTGTPPGEGSEEEPAAGESVQEEPSPDASLQEEPGAPERADEK